MASDNRDSISNTIIVAVGVCLVCATFVSVAAVGLRTMQQDNKLLDKKRNILAAAGLDYEGLGTSELKKFFSSRIEDRIIDLETGENVTDQYRDAPDYDTPGAFDQIDAAESGQDDLRIKLTRQQDIATIKTREKHSHVYVVKAGEDDDTPIMYVFPIRGKGLWSILKGFIALDADLNTIRGITYYEHAETPGLGGEVDNTDWKKRWIEKRLFDDNGNVAMKLLKMEWEDNPHAVDALSGATITSRGVENMLEFWMGEMGFGPFLEKLKANSDSQVNRETEAADG